MPEKYFQKCIITAFSLRFNIDFISTATAKEFRRFRFFNPCLQETGESRNVVSLIKDCLA